MSARSSRPFLTGLLVVLTVLALAGFVALFNDYQNNSYFREYVGDHARLIMEQVVVVGVFASVAGFFAYMASGAQKTSRLGRFSYKIKSLFPIIAGVAAFLFWFTLLGRVVGDSLVNLELYSVAIVF